MSFNDLINDPNPVLVDFSAEWCGPCKAMGPVLQQVASKLGNSAKVVKIDVDTNRNVAMQYGIQGVPTFILFQNGEVKWRQSGMMSASNLENVINQFTTAN